MKITNKRLQQIIKEELNEMMGDMPPLDDSSPMPSLDDIPAGDMDEQHLRSAISQALRSLGPQKVKEICDEETQTQKPQEPQIPPMMESKKRS